MTEASLFRARLQAALLELYRRGRRSKVMSTPTGRYVFEGAYILYKIALEAGPISGLKAYVSPDHWVIDVGANIGLFTTRFARWIGPDARVIAIEPESNNFSSLQRRLVRAELDPRVIAIQAIAAEKPGILALEINPDHPGDHKIGRNGVPTTAVTLDALWNEHRCPPVSLIKIDVQGAEMRVLRGASDIIKRHRPALFVEIDEAALKRQNSGAEEIVSLLSAFDYRPYRLQRSGPPQPVSPRGLGNERYEDVLFLAEGRD